MGAIGFNASGDFVVSSDVLTNNVAYKDTPVTVTSWSYVGTTITLNVASHTFVSGDYIEVGGLTATTNIPNGVHLVTSVTATTVVFTYALTPTGTAGVSSATVKGYMTTNGRVENIGVGQTWQNVTGSRSSGITYTNTTGKPKAVSITGTYSASSRIILTVAGIKVGENYGHGDGVHAFTVFAIVPNNSTYIASGTFTLDIWSELQ